MTGDIRFPQPFLANEHALATDPPLARDTGAFWRRRLRPFAGRALTHTALEAEQTGAAGVQRLRGQSVRAGTVAGLAVARLPGTGDPWRFGLQIDEGLGLARSGEDVRLRARRIDLRELPVIAPPDWFGSEDAEDGAAEGGENDSEGSGSEDGGLHDVRSRIVGPTLGDLIERGADGGLPPLAILVAQPVTVFVADDGGDPGCPPDRRDIGFLDPIYVDGARLALFAWPTDLRAVDDGPSFTVPPGGDQRRNLAADMIFAAEARHGREDAHPWEEAGVPLALIGFGESWQIDFIDTAAVQRIGGGPLPRTALRGTRPDPYLAQARLDQFSAQLAEFDPADSAAIRRAFAVLPPAGVLPGSLIDLGAANQKLFSDRFAISLAPVMVEEAGRIIQESADLEPISLHLAAQVELLLPLPAAEYDPGLFVPIHVDPLFETTRRDLLDQRDKVLRSRESLRRQLDVLGLAAAARRGAWPGSDLVAAELVSETSPTMPLDASEATRLRAGTANGVLMLEGIGGALTLAEGDSLFVWLRVPANERPDYIDVVLRAAGQVYSAWWGGAVRAGAGAGPNTGQGQNSRLGDVPPSGSWLRAEIPVGMLRNAAGVSPVGQAPDRLRIEITRGSLDVGAIGRRDASDRYLYLAHGYLAAGIWERSTHELIAQPVGAESSAIGTVLRDKLLLSTALTDFTDRWKDYSSLDPQRALVKTGGLTVMVADLKRRLDRTNDAIDVGFVRARADIYRLRQYILGQQAASRLITSPALADLASRDESARASATDFSNFLTRLRQSELEETEAAKEQDKPATGTGSGTGSSSGTKGSGSGLLGGGLLFGKMPVTATLVGTLYSAQPISEAAKSTQIVSSPNLGLLSGVTMTQTLMMPLVGMVGSGSGTVSAATPAGKSSGSERAMGAMLVENASNASGAKYSAGQFAGTSAVSGTAFQKVANTAQLAIPLRNAALFGLVGSVSAADIVGQKPLPGIVERTVTVAERLADSEAAKSHEYALAGKISVVNTLTRLIAAGGAKPDEEGVALADLPVPGFGLRAKDADPKDPLTPVTLAQMVAPPAGATIVDVHRLDNTPGEGKTKIHEADYFNAAVGAIDDAVALMRLVEGRVDLMEKLYADAEAVLARIRVDAGLIETALSDLDLDFAEIRHDLLVTEALLAEETARVNEVRTRRAALIARYGQRIVFRRPRHARLASEVPASPLASALRRDPVVMCLAEHADQPEELREYVSLLHDVPVGWFPEIAAAVDRLDRREAAMKALITARARAATIPLLSVERDSGAVAVIGGKGGVVRRMAMRRTQISTLRVTTAQMDLSVLHQLDLSALLGRVRELTSVADLIDGARERPALARLASSRMDEIAQVAACLHARFADVSPAIRVRWAEQLSVHDDVQIRLNSLAVLPEWQAISLALRRELQDLVDWLFGRIDNGRVDAVDAMDDLVRICLLLAAHAPVDRLIPATLIEPVPLRPGILVPLRVPQGLVRLGQEGLVRDFAGKPVALIRAEAIGPDRVDARVVRDFGIATRVETSMTIALGAARLSP